MARVLGVNGIHNFSWGNDSFTDRILRHLAHNHYAVDVRYPRMLAVLAYFQSQIDRRAEKLLEVHQPGDCVVAHSFGCLLTLRAMELGAEFNTVFFFGAAADSKYVMPSGFKKLYNVHSTEDNALALGKKLPGHPFGELGSRGYEGFDRRVENIPAPGYDHNQYADERYIKFWVNVINEKIPASF